MKDSKRRAIRTLVQLIAGGGLAALTQQLAGDVPAAYVPYLMIGYTTAVSLAQNYAEDQGWIPAVLKAKASDGAEPVTHDPAK